MRRGGKPVDGRVTDLSGTTDGLSRVHGKWSGALVSMRNAYSNSTAVCLQLQT